MSFETRDLSYKTDVKCTNSREDSCRKDELVKQRSMDETKNIELLKYSLEYVSDSTHCELHVINANARGILLEYIALAT